MYFLGSEGIILEFIACDADVSTVSSKGENPQFLSIGEVGIGVVGILLGIHRRWEHIELAKMRTVGDSEIIGFGTY
ncbi:hypothetical protein [Paeniglutamicibacter kerguelensis]|uniref:Uncharacterized protein n=1 Tax=Paeniglutamicibacter kerguelensis TaxID=254788 RepID=A0ABS4XDM7_9MICC|nr:hypothetical protein [Paeniglutamicibacter kerguelensis]MBP2386333.1 hypothetical protein [Paeniglutamicibacter kerguelensis]